MLLAAYDPTLHRIGLGASSAVRNLESELRRSTLRLCSLGLGGHSQAVMVTAAVGVSMCGDYIHDPGEQKAVEQFLNILEREHAWSTQNIMAALRDAWGSQHQRSESFSVFEGRPI